MAPVSDAVSLLVDALGEVPLIGFAGAPFTLASYLVEGGPSKHHERTKAMMLAEPATWHALMTALTDITIAFLQVQLDAGVDAIQVFDSWAGTLSLADYRDLRAAAQRPGVRRRWPRTGVPMTHFGVGTAELLGAMSSDRRGADGGRRRLAHLAGRRRDPGAARDARCRATSIPVVLLAGWDVGASARRARSSTTAARAVDAGAAGHVFNLGHGVLPATDPGRADRPGGAGALVVTSARIALSAAVFRV